LYFPAPKSVVSNFRQPSILTVLLASQKCIAEPISNSNEDPFKLDNILLKKRLLEDCYQVLEHLALWQAKLFEDPDKDYLAMIKRLLNKIINSYLEISDIQVKSDMKKETI